MFAPLYRFLGAILIASGFVFAAFGASYAGESDIVDVKVSQQSNGNYRFSVTVRHTDEGWEHYADGWEVVGPDGVVIARRKLWHPHVDEQPFTRDLSDVKIPAGITAVKIRSHDSVHGYGGREFVVELPR